ncbi:MAG: DNA-binding protein [Gallionellaceae bacterium]|jgi:hypothetical protein
MTTPKSLVTYEAVAAACEAITASGSRPSVRGIIAHLGGGSPNSVLDYQRQWKAGRPVVKASDIQIDPRIGQIIAEQISAAVTASRADIEGQLFVAEQDAEVVSKSCTEAEARVTALESELELAKGQIQSQSGQIDHLKTAAEQVKADAAEQVKIAEARSTAAVLKAEEETLRERAAAEVTRMALAKAELRLEAMPRIEAEIVTVRAELLLAQKQASEQHEAAAVATARLELEVAQRKVFEIQLSESVRQREEAAKRATSNAEQLSDAKVLAQANQSRLDAAEQMIVRLTEEVATANKSAAEAIQDAKKSGEEAAELRGHVNADKAKKVESVEKNK